MELIRHRLTQKLGRGRISEDDVVKIQHPRSKESRQTQSDWRQTHVEDPRLCFSEAPGPQEGKAPVQVGV